VKWTKLFNGSGGILPFFVWCINNKIGCFSGKRYQIGCQIAGMIDILKNGRDGRTRTYTDIHGRDGLGIADCGLRIADCGFEKEEKMDSELSRLCHNKDFSLRSK